MWSECMFKDCVLISIHLIGVISGMYALHFGAIGLPLSLCKSPGMSDPRRAIKDVANNAENRERCILVEFLLSTSSTSRNFERTPFIGQQDSDAERDERHTMGLISG